MASLCSVTLHPPWSTYTLEQSDMKVSKFSRGSGTLAGGLCNGSLVADGLINGGLVPPPLC